MKIAIITDTHCGVRNSSEIFLNNAAEFYDTIFFPYCLENNIKHILHLGNYYDNRKIVNFKAFKKELGSIFKEVPLSTNGKLG